MSSSWSVGVAAFCFFLAVQLIQLQRNKFRVRFCSPLSPVMLIITSCAKHVKIQLKEC